MAEAIAELKDVSKKYRQARLKESLNIISRPSGMLRKAQTRENFYKFSRSW